MNKQAIIVVSFGTSYKESRKAAIEAIEQTIAEAFPGFAQYRAFTSKTIIEKLKQRDGLEIDSVEKALERAGKDGVKRLVVQPTHFMDGFEYGKKNRGGVSGPVCKIGSCKAFTGGCRGLSGSGKGCCGYYIILLRRLG